MKSDRGEIEVFLCPEDENLSGHPVQPQLHHQTFNVNSLLDESEDEEHKSDPTLPSPFKFESTLTPKASTSQMISAPLSSLETATSWNPNSDDHEIKNVMIWASDDLGHIGNRFQQQTVDQDHLGNNIFRETVVFFLFSPYKIFSWAWQRSCYFVMHRIRSKCVSQ